MFTRISLVEALSELNTLFFRFYGLSIVYLMMIVALDC